MAQIPLRELATDDLNPVPIRAMSMDSIPLDKIAGEPNRHTFYEIFLVTEGKGTHTIDFNELQIEPGSIFLVSPYQVHQWKIEAKVRGYVVLFDDSALLDGSARRLLSKIYSNDKYLVEQPQMRALLAKVLSLKDELDSGAVELHREASSLWLNLLVLEITRLNRGHVQDNEAHNGSSSPALSFARLASQNFAKHRQSKWYANELGTSTSYLSQVVKAEIGVTPGEYLRAKVISEARRQLLYTDTSVEEIARQLNFQNPSYFGRFFRRETGQAPREFARSMQ